MTTSLASTSVVPSDPSTLRVVIADSLAMSRVVLRSMLARHDGCAVVGETFDGAGAVQLVREQRPQVLVVDLAMPRVFDALRQLRDSDTGVRPVVVAAAIRGQAVVTALTLGARGVLRRNVRPSALAACVRTVAQGGYWIGEDRVEDVVDAFERVRVGTSPLSGDVPPRQPDEDVVVARRLAGFRGTPPATSSRWRGHADGESASMWPDR